MILFFINFFHFFHDYITFQIIVKENGDISLEENRTMLKGPAKRIVLNLARPFYVFIVSGNYLFENLFLRIYYNEIQYLCMIPLLLNPAVSAASFSSTPPFFVIILLEAVFSLSQVNKTLFSPKSRHIGKISLSI